MGGYLLRSVRWLIDRTKVDGLRLDAVKHVGSEFWEKYTRDMTQEAAEGKLDPVIGRDEEVRAVIQVTADMI